MIADHRWHSFDAEIPRIKLLILAGQLSALGHRRMLAQRRAAIPGAGRVALDQRRREREDCDACPAPARHRFAIAAASRGGSGARDLNTFRHATAGALDPAMRFADALCVNKPFLEPDPRTTKPAKMASHAGRADGKLTTGLPRRMMQTGSPAAARVTNSLRRALGSATLTRFITLS